MIITISGLPGSGKSTIGRMLAKQLGYKFYSMGDLRGKIAMDHGMTIDELNKIGEKEEWTDRDVDAYQEKLGRTEDNFVVDGWISFHFIPHSFKIFLKIEPSVAAQRIFKNPRPDEAPTSSVEEMQEMLRFRLEQTDARYHKYYGISFRDERKFDLIIDTTRLTPEEIVKRILTAVKKA